MFISGGENVYPAEVEQALYAHHAVHQCAVIGVPHAIWGEVGRAYVVLKPGLSADEGELIAHLRGRLARYKVPRAIEFRDSLPVSGSGKILKAGLREEYPDPPAPSPTRGEGENARDLNHQDAKTPRI
jgi:fatty-acyl-CoA synthase